MIISKTPLRISFVGGGTDIKKFYMNDFGSIVSVAINKYMYVLLDDHFYNDHFRISYTSVEDVTDVNSIKHEIVKEAIRISNANKGLQIITTSDIPSEGSGLGSSSSLTVGLLSALYAWQGKKVSKERLAEEACKIEIEILGAPIGKQDQYAAAYGGMNYIQFNSDETVNVNPIVISNTNKSELLGNLMLFYTGTTRKANPILFDQQNQMDTKINIDYLIKMRDLCLPLKQSIKENNFKRFGELINQNWKLKTKLSKKISNQKIDEYYKKALKEGAIGGKILGAGGGGFMLIYCDKKYQSNVRKALSDFELVSFDFANNGSQVFVI